MSSSSLKFRFSIDRGGTFTDIYCDIYDSSQQKVIKQRVTKLLSEDPNNYKDAPTEGIRRILEEETGESYPRSQPVSTKYIDFIRMGTTVATNALLERKGERIALITTAGFHDLQLIGNQSRPKIFDLKITRPELLYEHVIEINERVILVKEEDKEKYSGLPTVMGKSQESLIIEKSIDEDEVRNKLQILKNEGIKSIAVVFIHSYTFSDHEQRVREIAKEMGFEQISISSEIMPMIRVIPRGGTTCVDAYLTPIIKKYLASFISGFDNNIVNVNVLFMQSDGGLTPMNKFLGNRAILSGPAGGVVGYAITSSQATTAPVIGFDMGGTSTDVSRYHGSYEHVFETTTAGITISSPQLDINTVAAGGGSRLFYKNNLFVVGPESAGAHPGPVCYRKNGYLTVTDANVLLGRIQPHLFPAIFGPKENDILDYHATKTAFEEISTVINQSSSSSSSSSSKSYSIDEIAYGFIRVANEAMARPIRNLTTMKGYDVTKHSLACFGGAGPQHCCAIAKTLGMRKVLVHKYSGILSAYGLSLADIVVERQEPFNSSELSSSLVYAQERLTLLEQQAKTDLLSQGFSEENIEIIHYLNCRYHGTDTSSMTCLDRTSPNLSYSEVFVANYRREYGFELKDRAILIDDIRVRAIGKSDVALGKVIETSDSKTSNQPQYRTPEPTEYANVFFDLTRMKTPIFFLSSLSPLDKIIGPAIIMQAVATVIVEPNCTAIISSDGDIEITIDELEKKEISEEVDPIYLSVFSHRFMGIAEQMGRTLQRTSISVNIKERLDFSCALFDWNGGLVANAPHLPVHLGAMSEAVRYQIKYWGYDKLHQGDVLVSNHPQLAGGSHLPDITVITPIFHDGKIVFFVASRGHHADIGGIAPGSMPPLSKVSISLSSSLCMFVDLTSFFFRCWYPLFDFFFFLFSVWKMKVQL
jgi:5-oxoprolinase (ATP-hydrolysing)